MLSWDLFIAIGWGLFAFLIWINPKEQMPKSVPIALMLILATDHFFAALEKAYS